MLQEVVATKYHPWSIFTLMHTTRGTWGFGQVPEIWHQWYKWNLVGWVLWLEFPDEWSCALQEDGQGRRKGEVALWVREGLEYMELTADNGTVESLQMKIQQAKK